MAMTDDEVEQAARDAFAYANRPGIPFRCLNDWDSLSERAREVWRVRVRAAAMADAPIDGPVEPTRAPEVLRPFSVREAMREAGLPGWEAGSGVSSADAIRSLAAARDAAQADAAKFKARCYPTSNDVFERGVTREQCEAWLLGKGATFTAELPRKTKRWAQSWALPTGEEWLPVTWEIVSAEISGLIEWAADALGLDQWAVLEEMATIEVSQPAPPHSHADYCERMERIDASDERGVQ